MTRTRVDLSVQGRKIAGLTAAGGAAGSALIVALHGGGYNSGYFDVPVDIDVVESAKASVEPVPLAEMIEIIEDWPENVAKLAAAVTVPVQYTLAEYDGLWVVDESRVATFTGYFTSAPWVDARLQDGAGHNLDHHRLSRALHLRQLAFACECTARTPAARG